jgi:nucleoid DNA-binding protein
MEKDAKKNSENCTIKTFVENLREEYDVSCADAKSIVGIIFETIFNNILNGKKVVLRDIGILKVKDCKKRIIHSGITGERHVLPSQKKVVFSAHKHLTEELQNKKKD